jgi:hypothetical protein
VRLDAVRRFALALPETTEAPHFDKASFRVKGKVFCTVPPGMGCLHVYVGEEQRQQLVADDPAVFEDIVSGRRTAVDWVRIKLAPADSALVKELLEDAWRHFAPPKVRALRES